MGLNYIVGVKILIDGLCKYFVLVLKHVFEGVIICFQLIFSKDLKFYLRGINVFISELNLIFEGVKCVLRG
jgi:hypothetical protein